MTIGVGPAAFAAAVAEHVDTERAREVARQILSEEPFLRRRSPRPFDALLERLGDWFVDPVGRLLASIGRALPEIGSPPWLVLALAVVAAAVVVTVRLARDRSRERILRAAGPAAQAGMSPAELERMAEAAEQNGDLAGALRLRFRAGLLRLDGAGVIELRPGLTNAAASRAVRSRRFDTLAGDFDEVVYGGRAATTGDVDEARAEWPRLLEEAGRR